MSENLVPAGIYCVGIPAPVLAQGMTELSASELRVLLYIYLHTLGYKKTEDSLSYEQFLGGVKTRDGQEIDKGAGVSRRALVTALSGLEQKGYIERKHAAGANFAPSSKICLKFEAKEFQLKEQAQSKQLAKPASEIKVQNLPLTEVQSLHLSCKNQHIINQDDEKEPENLLPGKIGADNSGIVEAVNYLVQNIPNLARHEAQIIAQTALVKNARDLAYLKRLVEYILSRPKIHTPAAVLAQLVKNNAERSLVNPQKTYSGKNTSYSSFSKTDQSANTHRTFPAALRAIAATNPVALAPEILFSEKIGCIKQNNSSTKKSKNKAVTGFVQTAFNWVWENYPQSQFANKQEFSTSFEAEASSLSHQLIAKNIECELETTMQQICEDITGRLRFSVSSQLTTLLKGASLQIIRQEQEKIIIQLKFANEFVERLILPQDYQIIRLSLRQRLGQTYILQTSEEFSLVSPIHHSTGYSSGSYQTALLA